MKNYITLVALFVFTVLTAQSRKGDFRLVNGCNSHTLYISFTKSIAVNAADNYSAAAVAAIEGFNELNNEYAITLKPGLPFTAEELQQMEASALKVSGNAAAVHKLRNIFTVQVANAGNTSLYSLAAKLEQLKDVEYCSLMPNEPVKPPGDIAPVTPNFVPLQNYLGTGGVNMEYAWAQGLTGEGINIRDIEYGFNKNHEELIDVNAAIGPGINVSPEADVDFKEHGTAVLGILFADNGNYGITGMAHGANQVLLYPEYSVQAGYNRVYTVTKALANSQPGDVVLYEMQAPGAQGEYGPAEYDNVIWDLTKAATDAGVVIIAAAGNGAENLNASAYLSYRNRGDSGAVIVGAGSPDMYHNRLDYSTYGTRVDVQGWGYEVFTTGYTNLPSLNNDFNQRYSNFSGTSSATPIVASCAIVLQSYYRSLYGTYMTGVQVRHLLKTTGIPQGNALQGNIGPLPDMMAAMQKVEEGFLKTATAEEIKVIIYPNPVQDYMNITGNNLSGSAAVEVYNVLGQLVQTGGITNNKVNVAALTKGVYTVIVTDNGKSTAKKIIKQ